MAPDFEYFIRFKPKSTVSHSFLGVLLFDVPIVILVALLFHKIIKKPLIMNLPGKTQNLFVKYISGQGLKTEFNYFVFIYSAIIGIFSHIIWDSFTHKGGYFVDLFKVLQNEVVFREFHIPIYKFLQHGSTLLGFLFMFCWFARAYRKISKRSSVTIKLQKLVYWGSIAILTVGILFFNIIRIKGKISLNYIGIYIVTCISSFFISLVIVSFVYRHSSSTINLYVSKTR